MSELFIAGGTIVDPERMHRFAGDVLVRDGRVAQTAAPGALRPQHGGGGVFGVEGRGHPRRGRRACPGVELKMDRLQTYGRFVGDA